MAIELRWITSTTASALAAAAALARGGRIVDGKTAAALLDQAVRLAADLAALDVRPWRFFEHAIPLSIHCDDPRQLAARLVAKLIGPRGAGDAENRLSERLTALDGTFQRAHPQALAELELRAEPLRQQWEARGPGLLANLARLTQSELLVERADVILVQPVAGGGGSAHWSYNAVSIEAVLTNAIGELPEVVRLGWLLAQLNLDLPIFQGELSPGRVAEVGPLAMIPPVLAAAQEVELAHCDLLSIAAALEAWRIPAREEPDSRPLEAGALLDWWETFHVSRPPWSVALGALDRMLDQGAPPDDTSEDAGRAGGDGTSGSP